MGLFDVFRKPKPAAPDVPSVMARPATSAYASVTERYATEFRAEMASVGLLTPSEIEAAVVLICGGDGCMNQHRYHQQVFDQFFRDKAWSWPWYDTWKARFEDFGAFPVRWPAFRPYEPPSAQEVVTRLTVANLKVLMTSAGLVYPDTAKGAALRSLALESAESCAALQTSPTWPTIVETVFKPRGFPEYTMLMRTILFRAKCNSDRSRSSALGRTGWSPIGVDKQDQRFIDYALSLDPNSSTPLYPGDVTVMRSDGPNFAE
jgi:hypothetical protein